MVPVLLPAPTAPFPLSGVVVAGEAPVEDCGVAVVVDPEVPSVPVPTVEPVVPIVSGVGVADADPGVPSVPVPTVL